MKVNRIEGLAHCAIYVQDLKQAEAFYCNLLGFEKIYLYQGNTLFVQRGSMVFELIEDGMWIIGRPTLEQIRHLAMACKEIERIYNYLKANEVAIEEPGLVHLPDFGLYGARIFCFGGQKEKGWNFRRFILRDKGLI